MEPDVKRFSKLPAKRVFEQFRRDALGKDEYRGVTLSYAWLSNQFGHFSLGFITAVIIFFIHVSTIKPEARFIDFGRDSDRLFLSVLFSAIFWMLVELYNFLVPLRKSILGNQVNFSNPWRHLISDWITDVIFFWNGAAVFGLMASLSIGLMGKSTFIVTFLIYIIPTFFLARFWFIKRIYQEHANFPFSLRLCQWNGNAGEKSIEQINRYFNSNVVGRHLLLFGEIKSQKNNLAVALGNEFAIRKKRVTYLSFIKFLRMLHEDDDELRLYNGGSRFWTWRESECVIIDHIHPGDPVEWTPPDPKDIFKNISKALTLDGKLDLGERNIKTLKNQNFIWVVGDVPDTDTEVKLKRQWKEMLTEQLGLSEDQIFLVDLTADS